LRWCEEVHATAAFVEPRIARRHRFARIAVPQHVGPADDLGQQEIAVAQPQQGPRLPAARPGSEGFSGEPPEKLARVTKTEKPAPGDIASAWTESCRSQYPNSTSHTG